MNGRWQHSWLTALQMYTPNYTFQFDMPEGLLLLNIVRHIHSNKVFLKIRIARTGKTVIVEDDLAGFPSEGLRTKLQLLV